MRDRFTFALMASFFSGGAFAFVIAGVPLAGAVFAGAAAISVLLLTSTYER